MVKTVEILTGGTCNLQCDYCFLCKIKALHGLDDDVVEGLQSGSYLENVKKVFKKTGNNPLAVEEMTCWGGEPTIHLPLLTEKLKDWLDFFPNITRICFATNGTFKVSNMIDFLSSLDDKVKDRKELHIAIQVSLDGPDCVTLKNRGIKESFITNNIISLIEELNKFKFKKLKVGFIFKPTIPVEDYNKIHGSIQEATEYYEYWANLLKTLNEVNNSLNVEHIRAVQVLHAGIYNHTQQEGLDLTRSLNVYNALDWGRINDIAQYNLRKDMSFFNYIEEWTGRANEFAETSPYCGSFVGSLFIRPDGSLIGCLAGLLNDNPEYNKYLEENNIESEIKITNMTPSKLYFNPLKATKEQIDNFFEHKNSMQYRSDRIWYALSASMLYELAYAGQADPRYIHDKNLLLRHCYLLMARIECWYNNVRNTGSSYITLPGVLRLYGNGAMFVFEDYINNLDRYIGERGLNNEPFVDCENRG